MTYQGNKWKHFGNILEIFWKHFGNRNGQNEQKRVFQL
jgi:hypothetical protein